VPRPAVCRRLLVAPAALLLACSPPAPEPDPQLFTPGQPARIELVVSPAMLTRLDDPAHKPYVRADLRVTFDGRTESLRDIGLRLKGSAGSLRGLDGKPAFLLSFDRYVAEQRLDGLEKLALNNMVQDPSMEREGLGYPLFRALGVPAPRSGHALVTVNGEPYGLYATVESLSNTVFLETWFGDAGGNLYEAGWGSDLTLDALPGFDHDGGLDIDRAELSELFTALDALIALADPDIALHELERWIDLDLYLLLAATEIYLGHWDGHVDGLNNYFIYHRPADRRWVVLPWGIDQTLDRDLAPFDGHARLQTLCLASLACRARLASQHRAVIAMAKSLNLPHQARSIADALRDHVAADPRKEIDDTTVADAVDANITFLRARPRTITDGLVCTDPAQLDDDGDGFSGCDLDCDDADPDKHPGASERCNLADDDCDGLWDNDPACPRCIIEHMPDPLPGRAAYCFDPHPWSDAEADCVAQGGHLLSIHDAAINDRLFARAAEIRDDSWWIGLHDQTNEGTFVWTDGSPLDLTLWSDGEPNDAHDEDCAQLWVWQGGAWNDAACDSPQPYICRLP
jgi:hypothetical protein